MTNENSEDMARLERIRGRIDLFRESASVGPKGIILDDMVWMEGMLRRFLRAEVAQTKFLFVGNSTNNHPVMEQKIFERVGERKSEWRHFSDERTERGEVEHTVDA